MLLPKKIKKTSEVTKTRWDSNEKFEAKTALIIAITIFYLCQREINAELFLGDAKDYWFLASKIWDFSFPPTIRGYFYPLILSPAKALYETLPNLGLFPLRAFQALLYGTIFTIILPKVFLKIFNGNCSPTRRLIAPVLLSVFFPGLVSYPLSDLPAFSTLLLSIYILMVASERQTKIGFGLLMTASGFLAYGAYNIRSIYIFPVLMLLLMIPTVIVKNRTAVIKIIGTLTFIIGASAASLPQILINIKNFKTATPLVISNINGSSLFAAQLKWGIAVQRYETRIDKEQNKAYPVFYFDPEADNILLSNPSAMEPPSIKWYINLVTEAPLSLMKIYIRHFINGLDVRDSEAYTTTPSSDKTMRSVSSISISYFGILLLVLAIFKKEKSNSKISRFLWITIFLLPVAAILPGAIETRFFLSLHILIYSAIAFLTGPYKISKIKKRYLLIAIAVFAILVVLSFKSAATTVISPLSSIPERFQKIIER